MERSHIIGFILIFGILLVWTFVNSPSKEQMAAMKERQDSLNRVEILKDSIMSAQNPDTAATTVLDSAVLASKYGSFASAVSGINEKIRLENDYFIVDFETKGGKITGVELKDYKKIIVDSINQKIEVKVPLLLLEDPDNVWDISLPSPQGDLHTADLNFSHQVSGNKIVFTALGQQGERVVQEYELTGKPYEIKYNLIAETTGGSVSNKTAQLTWTNYLDKIERNHTFERGFSTMYFKENTESVDYCNCRKSAQENLSEQPVKWFSHSNQFFNSTLIANESFDGGVFSTNVFDENNEDLKSTTAVVGLPVTGNGVSTSMTMYIGPNDFENLRSYRVELEDIIPFGRSIFGSINRWVIRPLFNFLLGFIGSEGIVILLLTLLVKLALFPLSYRMLQSQAKMAALKPQMAGLREKYKDDMQKQQMETMKVYREYGVNPLGGCFPVVMQMPVWFALYRFFPASIEFRQASFLWATDLSSYDVFFTLPFEIPFGFGSHVSMLTLLWTISTLVYTYYNMQNMDMGNMNPMLKYMQYVMPVMFLVFFNSYASGLTLYLLYSNLLNIAQTLGAKKFLFDEDRIMEGLNKNKAKPKKEGGFQSRLEKVMKEQQRIAEARKSPAAGTKKKN